MSQALFWNLFAKKLNKEATAEELRMLDELITQNPALVYQAEHIEHLWNTKNPHNIYESELAFELHLNRLKENGLTLPETDPLSSSQIAGPLTKTSQRSFKRKWLLSVPVLACLAVAAFIWMREEKTMKPLPEKNFGEVSTRPGSKTKLVLPDSTVVWLNSGSKLTYSENFGIANRNTTLVGEAFFDVKKSTIPFIIHAKNVQIKVLGTAFNVKAYPDEKTTETSLLRGRVEITLDKRPGEPFILKPNEKLIVSNEPEETKTNIFKKKVPIAVLGNITRSERDSTILETSWVENKLVFNDETFAEVAKKMERWYGVNISFKDEKVAEYRLYGSFTTETINEALEYLKMSSQFTYKIEGQNIMIAK